MDTFKGVVDFVTGYPLWAQILGISGLLVTVLTFVFAPHTAPISHVSYQDTIRITSPRGGEGVDWEFRIVGTFESVPDDVELWIMTTDDAGQRYWPQERVILDTDHTWNGRVTGIGGNPGERRTFGVFAVGSDGKALLELWKRAIPYKKALELRRLTNDIYKIQEVDVVVKSEKPD